MRILMVGINFWPEPTGIGKYSGEMAEYLCKAGHQVTVITAPPYYPYWRVQPPYNRLWYQKENWNGIRIIRCPLFVPKKVTGLTRLMHLLSFTFAAMPKILVEKSRHDLLLNIAPTLFTANLASYSLQKKRHQNWLHIQDFELDAALNLGVLRSLPLMEKLARYWEKTVYRRFGNISTISHAMMDRLIDKGIPVERVVFFPNWIDVRKIFPLTGENLYRKQLGFAATDIVLLYSGSIGQKQGIEILIEAMRLLINQTYIHLVICGEGPGKAELVASALELRNVHFLPVQPVEMLNELLNMADIHILPQKKGASDLVMPSKLLGMLASGKPVIVTCLEGSELFKIVRETGLVIPPEDTNKMVAAISRLATDKGYREELGKRGRNQVEKDFSADQVLCGFEQKIMAISGEKR